MTEYNAKHNIIVYAAFIPPTFGGAELYSYYIALKLSKYYILTLLTRSKKISLKPLGASSRIIYAPGPIIPLILIILFFIKKPKILHVLLYDLYTPILFLLAKLLGMKTILTYHGTYLTGKNILKKYKAYRIVFLLDQLILGLPFDVFVSVDNFSKNIIKKILLKKHLIRPIYLVPSAVDTALFKPYSKSEIINEMRRLPKKLVRRISGIIKLRHNNYLVLCPRRIDPKNGIDVLIKAIAILKKQNINIKVVIAGRVGHGSEEYYNYLQFLIKTLNLENSVLFLGNIDHKYMPILYNISDIVVIPSLAEARSLAALEAMACGKIVVASKVGGLTEIISDGYNGFLVEPGNPKLLANTMLKIIKNRKKLKKIEENARKYSLTQSWDVRAQQYSNIYKKLIRDLM